MHSVYFARHGQTIWNVEDKICGATDIELTNQGHQQATRLGNKIKEEKLCIDEIVYSPLVRAAETARHVHEITGIPMREEKRITEQNFGKFEGFGPRQGGAFEIEKQKFVCSYEGGESMLKLAARVYNLLDEIRDADKTYLLVAHGGIARMVNSYFFDMTNEEFAKFGLPNCAVLKYDFK